MTRLIEGSEVADTYETLSTLNRLVGAVHEAATASEGSVPDPVETYRSLVKEKRNAFGVAQSQTSFKITDYREQWGDSYPTIETAPLTTTEQAFLETLGIVGSGERVQLPVAPNAGDRLPVLIRSTGELRRVRRLLNEFQPPSQQTKLLHLSDTHLGFHLRGTHPDAGGATPSWHKSLTPTEAFEAAVAIARQERVDAVVHTGDLFDHNVDQPTLDRTIVALEALAKASIPFYCILGDHDRNATGGAFPVDVDALATLADMVDNGIVTLLGGTPARVGSVALYGIDADNVGLDAARSGQYALDFWEDPTLSFDSPPAAARSVLCLHERVAPPYRLSEKPDCLLDVHLPDNGPSFDLIAVGHEHGPHRKGLWRDTTVTYAGPTERFSSQWPDLQPSVSVITIPSAGKIEIIARPLGEQPADAQDGLHCSSTRAQ